MSDKESNPAPRQKLAGTVVISLPASQVKLYLKSMTSRMKYYYQGVPIGKFELVFLQQPPSPHGNRQFASLNVITKAFKGDGTPEYRRGQVGVVELRTTGKNEVMVKVYGYARFMAAANTLAGRICKSANYRPEWATPKNIKMNIPAEIPHESNGSKRAWNRMNAQRKRELNPVEGDTKDPGIDLGKVSEPEETEGKEQ